MFELDTGPSRSLCLVDWWPFEEGSSPSMWPFGCNCGHTEIVSPPGSPSRRGRSGQTLLARGREGLLQNGLGLPLSKGTVEVVQVATSDEMSDSQQASSSSLVLGTMGTEAKVRSSVEPGNVDNGSRSVKNSVRWQVEVRESSASPKSQKSQKSLEKAERTQKKRKTLHTWLFGSHIWQRLSAMLDVSEGGFDTVTVPEGGSPASYAHSRSRTLHPPSAGGGLRRLPPGLEVMSLTDLLSH
eukprot:Skav216483  [mRNA]  locus=scaffold1123:418900:419935:- [translate_table: standard]